MKLSIIACKTDKWWLSVSVMTNLTYSDLWLHLLSGEAMHHQWLHVENGNTADSSHRPMYYSYRCHFLIAFASSRGSVNLNDRQHKRQQDSFQSLRAEATNAAHFQSFDPVIIQHKQRTHQWSHTNIIPNENTISSSDIILSWDESAQSSIITCKSRSQEKANSHLLEMVEVLISRCQY